VTIDNGYGGKKNRLDLEHFAWRNWNYNAEAIAKGIASSQSLPFPANLASTATTLSLIASTIGQAKGILSKQKPPKYALGGMIYGASHNAGGVMIEAEGGEFVMSRRAVKDIGLDALKAMNAGVTVVNDQGPLAKALKERPNHTLVWDERGFTSYQRRNNDTVIKRQSRYQF